MNKRLQTIYKYIENGKGVVDVGTDHGYLPVELALNGYKGNIVASDINEDPLHKAVVNAEAAGVGSRISFLLCDGLSKCPAEKVDTIVIAGMGGDMIVKILDATEWCLSEGYKLILQPMSKAEVVRYWLVYNGFEIKAEELVDENNTLYQIIVAQFGGYTPLNDAQLFCGKAELAQDKELFVKELDLLHKRFSRAVKDMGTSDESPKYRLKLFEEILVQLDQMRD